MLVWTLCNVPLFSAKGGAGNRDFYENKKVDELLEKAKGSIDQDERKKLYEEAQILIVDDARYYAL